MNAFPFVDLSCLALFLSLRFGIVEENIGYIVVLLQQVTGITSRGLLTSKIIGEVLSSIVRVITGRVIRQTHAFVVDIGRRERRISPPQPSRNVMLPHLSY